MKPSRILKSAYTKAGKPGSLKSFARQCVKLHGHLSRDTPDGRLAAAAAVWLRDTKRGLKLSMTFSPLLGKGPSEADIAAYKERQARGN